MADADGSAQGPIGAHGTGTTHKRREDSTLVFAGAYKNEADAQLDYEAIKDLHAAGIIGGYDAAVIRRGDDGKVHVKRDDTTVAASAT